MKLFAALSSAAAAAALAACAQPPTDEVMRFADDPRLGPQVDRICFTRQIDGFGEATDDTVVLNVGVDDTYLVETFGVCRDLQNAASLSFEQFGTGCLRRGDSIIPYQSAFGPDNVGLPPRACSIKAIYEWSEDAGEPAN